MFVVVAKLYVDRAVMVTEKMTLKQAQEFVGGYVEAVPSNRAGHMLLVNEDGLRLQLKPNLAATAMVKHGTLVAQCGVVGDALLVESIPAQSGRKR